VARGVAPGTGTLVLDSEGLSKAAAGDETVGAFLKTALQQGHRVVVPAVTIAEVLRGGARDAGVHHVLNRVVVADVTRELARSAGEILGDVGGNNTIDALVAAVAVSRQGRVILLTSDVGDLAQLTAGRGDISVQAV
jgi:predicted nucleic acid-binding protein